MDSPGKSGAKFYQSYDKLYIIKALTSEEVELMHSFLKEYHPVWHTCSSESRVVMLLACFVHWCNFFK